MRRWARPILVITVTTSAALAVSASRARADTGVHFVDPRPATLYPSATNTGPWQVLVFNGGSQEVQVYLHATPNGIVFVDDPEETIEPDFTEAFDLKVGPLEGTAELTLTSSDGSIDHREVTVKGPSAEVALPETLSFSGLHAAPGSSLVLSGSVALAGYPTHSPSVEVGTLTSPAGRTGQIILAAGRLRLQGIHAAGVYTGNATLPDGRSVKVDAKIRDAVGLPLVVLILGLLIVGYLDRFNKRDKPRDVLRIELARLRAKAAAEQSNAFLQLSQLPSDVRPAGVHRITGTGTDGKLLLDQRTEAALMEWDAALDDAIRAPWAEGGPNLVALQALVDDLANAHTAVYQLGEAFAALLGRTTGLLVVLDAPIRVAYESATRPQDISAVADLVRLKQNLATAKAAVERFDDLLNGLIHIRDATADQEIQHRAIHLISQLCGGADVEIIDEARTQLAAAALDAASSVADLELAGTGAAAAVESGLGGAAGSPTVKGLDFPPSPSRLGSPIPLPAKAAAATGDVPKGSATTMSRAPGKAARALVVVAAVAAAFLVTLIVTLSGGGSIQSPTTTPTLRVTTTTLARTEQTTPPTFPPGLAFTGPLPEFDLPVGPPPGLAHSVAASVSFAAVTEDGFLLPVAAGGLLAALVFLIVRRHRQRHPDDSSTQTDAKVLASRLHADQRRFDVLSGLIVVLTGLSLLYFTNPTFGSLGDYAGLLLWGSGVGEGVQFARRILPSLPT
jgi:hypothetical protein